MTAERGLFISGRRRWRWLKKLQLNVRRIWFARAISFSYIAFIVSRSSRKFLIESSGSVARLPAGVAGVILET